MNLVLLDTSVTCTVLDMSIHDRIRRKREEAGLSQAELGRRVGVSTQAVQQWESTSGVPTAPRRGTRKKVAAALGVSLMWLEYGDELPGFVMEEQAKYVEGAIAGTRSVPVVGFAIATPDQDGYFDDMGYPPGAGQGYVRWPTKDKNAYSLEVKGDSMQPRIRPGERIVVEPNSHVSPGDDVVVRTKDGRKMVKQLLLRRSGEVTLGSINQQHRQTTISLDAIESIHFIAAIVPRGSTVEE
jgi:phage repressor protein C with HTH and peptisase S24 domain